MGIRSTNKGRLQDLQDQLENLSLEVARLERKYLPVRHAQRRSESQPVQEQRAVDGYKVTPGGLQAVTRLEGPHVVTPRGLEKAPAPKSGVVTPEGLK